MNNNTTMIIVVIDVLIVLDNVCDNDLFATSVGSAANAMTRGYVRPPASEYEKRKKLAELIYKYTEK